MCIFVRFLKCFALYLFLFIDINWHTLGNGQMGYQTDMVSTVDPNSFFKEQDLQECRNSLFDKF